MNSGFHSKLSNQIWLAGSSDLSFFEVSSSTIHLPARWNLIGLHVDLSILSWFVFVLSLSFNWMSNGGKRLLFAHDKLHIARVHDNRCHGSDGLSCVTLISLFRFFLFLRRQSWNSYVFRCVINWVGIVETEHECLRFGSVSRNSMIRE